MLFRSLEMLTDMLRGTARDRWLRRKKTIVPFIVADATSAEEGPTLTVVRWCISFVLQFCVALCCIRTAILENIG